MPRPGPSVTSGADLQPGSDSLFPSGFTGGGARPSAGSVGTGEIADGSVAATDLNLSSVATALAGRSEFTGTYALHRPAPTVALLGDSISNQDGDISSATVQNTSNRGYFAWANVLLNGAFTKVYNTAIDDEYGTSGQTTADILNNTLAADDLTAAVASTANVVIVHAGTNDVGAGTSAATIAANLLSIWTALRSAGKVVVATTILPRNNGADTTAMKQALLDANRLIRANALATRGVVLCDWYPALLNASTGLANSAYLIDTIHPNAIGASRLGAVLAQVLAPLAPGSATPDLAMSTTDTANILAASGLMVGTTGTISGAQVSGSLATGWSLFQDGTPTSVVASKVTRTDVYPGEWQQLVYTAATPTADGAHMQFQDTNVGTAWSVGDAVRATVEFQTDASGWDCRGLQVVLQCYNNTGSATGLAFTSAERTALTASIWRPPSGVVKTPPIVIPTGTIRLQLQLWFYGSGTIRYGRSQIVKNA